MLRAVVVALVLANVLFFGWTRGWFEPWWPLPQHGERESERLAAQVRPEAIVLLSPKAASAAVSAARAASMAAGEGERCLEAGPFSVEAEVVAVEQALQQAEIAREAFARRELTKKAVWAIYLGRFTTTEGLRTKSEELRGLGISAEEIGQPAEMAPGLLLARYEAREAAEAALPRWAERGVRGARVGPLAAASTTWWVRIDRASPALQEQLKAVKVGSADLVLANCQERR
jgi:hypothetical protein